MSKPWFVIRILVAISFPTLFFFTVRAQSVQEIVARHVEALGGKEKLQGINSVYQEGTAVLPNRGQMNFKLWQVYDKLYRQEMDLGAGKIVVIVTQPRSMRLAPHRHETQRAQEQLAPGELTDHFPPTLPDETVRVHVRPVEGGSFGELSGRRTSARRR